MHTLYYIAAIPVILIIIIALNLLWGSLLIRTFSVLERIWIKLF